MNAALTLNDHNLETLMVTNTPEVHPVLIVTMGTTAVELHLILKQQLAGRAGLVPWRSVAIDSLDYDNVINRQIQNGWQREQAMQALPRSDFFHLTSPFSDSFDFDSSLNRHWSAVVSQPALRRIARKPNAPGCAGTPALGRARIEGNEQDLRDFFERHLLQLTQIRLETLSLLEGVTIFLITTYRGGTGAGATAACGALLRAVMSSGSLHLKAIMPCVYQGDNRARANAYAMLRENQWHHRYDGGIAMMDNRLLKAPFDTTSYTFASNGAVTLSGIDALMQEASILRAYLHAPTQAAINARHVDLTDVMPHDAQDMPLHVRVETATTVRPIQPGSLPYFATEWIRQEWQSRRDAFEAWRQSQRLPAKDNARLAEAVEIAQRELRLDRQGLLARLESTSSSNTLRNYFEQATITLSSMKAESIKQSMTSLPAQIREFFDAFESSWQKRARHLAATLPNEITTLVTHKLGDAPHLALAVLERLAVGLGQLGEETAKDAEKAKAYRDRASQQFGAALKEVQEAQGVFAILRRDETTRDRAADACASGMAAALARVQQQQLEYLNQALVGEMTVLDGHGGPVVIPAAQTALQRGQVDEIARIRAKHAEQQQQLNAQLETYKQALDKRSAIFERALLYDDIAPKALESMVREIRAAIPQAPPLDAFLSGQQDLDATIAGLMPLLPSYAESGSTLTQMLSADAERRELVLRLLRQCKPFTPLDRVVEDQQGAVGHMT